MALAFQQVLASDAPAAHNEPVSPGQSTSQRTNVIAEIIPLRAPARWHDPLKLVQDEAPSELGRIVLWAVSLLILVLLTWAGFGKLDIIASAEGKLVPKTLVKIVQPAEAGIIKELLVAEGQRVKAGEILAKLDTTIASADRSGFASELAAQMLQRRRIEAELGDRPIRLEPGDNAIQLAQITSQYSAHRIAYQDSIDQERSLLLKAQHEKRSGNEILLKLEQTLPTFMRSAEAYSQLEKQGFVAGIAAAEKQREAIEKARDLDAQRAAVAALDAMITASERKINQLRSSYRSELERELADVRSRIQQLQPSLEKSTYKEGLMELVAPQDGTVKDLATTTLGAVVQPGTVVLTLVPLNEELYADISIRNEDFGFTEVGQTVQIKLASYPFQKYGMLTGKVIHLSADATESNRSTPVAPYDKLNGSEANTTGAAPYKARVQLTTQTLATSQGTSLLLSPGMQVTAELNQGKRTVLEYLISPVKKSVSEAGHER
jgi:hemolysin D